MEFKDEATKQEKRRVSKIASVTLILFFLFVSFSLGYKVATSVLNSSELGPSFASCLTEEGSILYGSDSCGYCSRQKELFGKDFKDIVYINCQLEQEKCITAEITAYPTWIIKGDKLVGLQPLERLAQVTGCKLK